jgi:hypothetical protein
VASVKHVPLDSDVVQRRAISESRSATESGRFCHPGRSRGGARGARDSLRASRMTSFKCGAWDPTHALKRRSLARRPPLTRCYPRPHEHASGRSALRPTHSPLSVIASGRSTLRPTHSPLSLAGRSRGQGEGVRGIRSGRSA